MVVHSEKEAHVVRLTQQLELLVAHPERVGQIVRTPVHAETQIPEALCCSLATQKLNGAKIML